MALQFRQGPNSDRLSVTPAAGEPIWITDTKQLFVGDGVTAGGVLVGDTSTFSTGTFNSVQIGQIPGNELSIVSSSLYIESTTSVVIVAQNGLAVEGASPGNANFYIDKIHSRFPNSEVTFINTATFEKPVNIEGRVQVGPGNDIGYISSNGAYNLNLTTNDTQGPGNAIQLVHGIGASIAFLQREGGYRTIASLGTGTSNFYSNSVQFLDQDSNGLLTFDSNGSTHYGNYHNFGNTNTNVQINSQGTGDLKLAAGSDANDSGYLRVTKTDVRLGGPTSLDMVTVNTSGVTISTTATIQGLKIGYNNGEISIPNVTADADNMWIRTTGNSGAIMMTCKTSAGANRNMAWANGRVRFDNSAVINPNTTFGSLTINGGQASGVDGPLTFGDFSLNNSVNIDPAVGVNITTTGTYNWVFGLEGLATLPVLSAAPATPTIGMLGVADGVTWDPAGYSTTTAYVTFYNGTAWTALG